MPLGFLQPATLLFFVRVRHDGERTWSARFAQLHPRVFVAIHLRSYLPVGSSPKKLAFSGVLLVPEESEAAVAVSAGCTVCC